MNNNDVNIIAHDLLMMWIQDKKREVIKTLLDYDIKTSIALTSIMYSRLDKNHQLEFIHMMIYVAMNRQIDFSLSIGVMIIEPPHNPELN